MRISGVDTYLSIHSKNEGAYVMTDGYLVYGEKLFENYSGCDSYGYKYNKFDIKRTQIY